MRRDKCGLGAGPACMLTIACTPHESDRWWHPSQAPEPSVLPACLTYCCQLSWLLLLLDTRNSTPLLCLLNSSCSAAVANFLQSRRLCQPGGCYVLPSKAPRSSSYCCCWPWKLWRMVLYATALLAANTIIIQAYRMFSLIAPQRRLRAWTS